MLAVTWNENQITKPIDEKNVDCVSVTLVSNNFFIGRRPVLKAPNLLPKRSNFGTSTKSVIKQLCIQNIGFIGNRAIGDINL